MVQHILYIPGFGSRDDTQRKVLRGWNKKEEVEVYFEPSNWPSSETYEAKLARIVNKIDELAGADGKISLVGVSAGASLTLNAYMARKDKISGIVFICGKLRNAEGVREMWFNENPAFRRSIFTCQENVQTLTDDDKHKILTLRSLHDGLIPAADSQIPGATNRTIPFIIHVPTIFLALTIFKNRTLRFLRNLSGVE